MTEDSRDVLRGQVRNLNTVTEAMKNHPLPPQVAEMAEKLEEKVRYLSWGDVQEERAELQAKAAKRKAAAPKPPTSPAPAVTAPRKPATEPAIDPPPVATRRIAFAFDGLRGWNEKAWKDTLGSPPKWLEACIVLRGQRGIRETHWNPVLIGAALVRAGHAKPNNIRARFQTKRQLEDWKDAWKTYEADNFDTQ